MRVSTWPLAALLCLGLHAPAGAGAKPGMPGYVAPWKRPARDSVVDLDPEYTGDRIEIRGARTEKQAVLHRGADGVYHATIVLDTGKWYEQPTLDSIRTATARKYDRAPWRGKGK